MNARPRKALSCISNPIPNLKKAHDISPDSAEIDVYRDVTRISRAFMREQMPTTDEVTDAPAHRGVRHSNERLTAQLIDNPNANEYRFDAPSVSNHTVDIGVANHWAEAYSITHQVTPDDVALAIDVLRPSGLDEGELHLIGEDIRVPADGGTFTGPRREDIDHRNGPALFNTLNQPDTADSEAHDHIYGFVRAMDEAGITPETQAGAERLAGWFETCVENDHLDDKQQRLGYPLINGLLGSMDTEVTLDIDQEEVQ
jgi:hypothetical protein